MIKPLIDGLLGRLGYRIIRLSRDAAIAAPPTQRPAPAPASHPAPKAPAALPPADSSERRRLQERIAEDPLNPETHLQYAIAAAKDRMPYLAYAELKTAAFLGADSALVERYAGAFQSALPDPTNMNHNQYSRFAALAAEIRARSGAEGASVLDVGGGQGQLAAFIPNAAYCLAEPSVNGISGIELPFPDRSFDYVVSCHVLEHIPPESRDPFLNQLVAKARRGVILLNPFRVPGTYVRERLELFIDVTGAQWAQEHLDCSLPTVDDVRAYAERHGLEFSARPNGTLTVSAAFVFVDHFAHHAGRRDEWNKVNAFFNRNFTSLLDSAEYPNAYLVYLGRPTGLSGSDLLPQPAPALDHP